MTKTTKDWEPKEYYCHDCKQLRLWLRNEALERCGNCNSINITIDTVNSEKLSKLRFGDSEQHD